MASSIDERIAKLRTPFKFGAHESDRAYTEYGRCSFMFSGRSLDMMEQVLEMQNLVKDLAPPQNNLQITEEFLKKFQKRTAPKTTATPPIPAENALKSKRIASAQDLDLLPPCKKRKVDSDSPDEKMEIEEPQQPPSHPPPSIPNILSEPSIRKISRVNSNPKLSSPAEVARPTKLKVTLEPKTEPKVEKPVIGGSFDRVSPKQPSNRIKSERERPPFKPERNSQYYIEEAKHLKHKGDKFKENNGEDPSLLIDYINAGKCYMTAFHVAERPEHHLIAHVGEFFQNVALDIERRFLPLNTSDEILRLYIGLLHVCSCFAYKTCYVSLLKELKDESEAQLATAQTGNFDDFTELTTRLKKAEGLVTKVANGLGTYVSRHSKKFSLPLIQEISSMTTADVIEYLDSHSHHQRGSSSSRIPTSPPTTN